MNTNHKQWRHQRPEKPAPSAPWWIKHFQGSPITTTAALLSTLGGLILLAFFLQLGETPDLDLKSSAGVFLAMALIGSGLASALTFCSFIAGLQLRSHGKRLAWLSEAWTIMFLLTGPTVGLAGLALWALLVPDSIIPSWGLLLPAAFPVLVGLWLTARKSIPTEEAPTRAARIAMRVEWSFELVGIGLLWLLVGYIALLVFWTLFPRGHDGFLQGLLSWTFYCYAMNFLVAWAPKNLLSILAWCIFGGVLCLSMTTGNGAALPTAVIRALGMGEVPVKMTLTEQGCDYLNKAAGSRVVCRVAPGDKTATACPVMLRSRIGSPLYVGLSAYDAEGRWPVPADKMPKRAAAIAIPKSDIPSWVQLAPAAASAPTSAASGAIVTYLDASDSSAWLREQCGDVPAPPPPVGTSTPATAASTTAASAASAAARPGSSTKRGK